MTCDREDASENGGKKKKRTNNVRYSRIGRDLVRGFISLLQHFRGASYSLTRRSQNECGGDRSIAAVVETPHANGTRVRDPMTLSTTTLDHARVAARTRMTTERRARRRAIDHVRLSRARRKHNNDKPTRAQPHVPTGRREGHSRRRDASS